MRTHADEMTVTRLCEQDPRWRLVEVGADGGWQRAELTINPDDVVSRIELRCPQRRRETGLLEPDPYALPYKQVQGLLLSSGGVPLDEIRGTESSVIGNVTRWLSNIDAGRVWNARPQLRDFFTARAWSPAGARLHVLLRPAAPLREYMSSTYGPVLREYTDVLRVVPHERLHVTLAWLDNLPSSALGQADLAAARAAVDTVIGRFPLHTLATIRMRPAEVRTYGVRCEAAQPEAIGNLITEINTALLSVWPAFVNINPTPPTSPAQASAHMTLAYGTGEVADISELRTRLDDAGRRGGWRDEVDVLGAVDVHFVHVDTFGPDPFTWHTA